MQYYADVAFDVGVAIFFTLHGHAPNKLARKDAEKCEEGVWSAAGPEWDNICGQGTYSRSYSCTREVQ